MSYRSIRNTLNRPEERNALHAAGPVEIIRALGDLERDDSARVVIAAGLARQRELYLTAFAASERRAGVAAYLEKRRPSFTGR